MLLNIEQSRKYGKHILRLSCFDELGKIKILEKEFPKLQAWRVTSNPGKRETRENWNGKKAVLTDVNRLTKFDILNIIDTQFTKEEQTLISAVNFPNYISLDIETEVVDGFPNPEFAKEKITAIALALPKNATRKRNIVVVLATKAMTNKEVEECKLMTVDYLKKSNFDWDFKYSYFDTEVEMLNKFVTTLSSVGSLCIGWNLDGFDYPYLKKRCEVLGVDFSKLSPVGTFDRQTDKPMHFGFYDYLEVYKKYDKFVKIKETNKLDYVSEQVLGCKKLQYDGTLQNMYLNDYVKYFAYNAIDAVLVMEIHNKLQTINTPLMMSAINNMSLYKASSFINLTEHLLYREFSNRGFVIADEFTRGVKTDYEGAYVKEPKPGIHKLLVCFDFASLYPSLARVCNMSPETFIKKVKDKIELEKYKNNKHIICVNGAVFKKTKKASALKAVLDTLYAARRHYKDRKLAIEDHLQKFGIILS